MTQVTIATPNLATIKSWLRQITSVAGIVVSLGNQLHLPAAQRAVLLAGSLWIQKVQHAIDTTNDPTTTATPVPTSGTSVSVPPTSTGA